MKSSKPQTKPNKPAEKEKPPKAISVSLSLRYQPRKMATV